MTSREKKTFGPSPTPVKRSCSISKPPLGKLILFILLVVCSFAYSVLAFAPAMATNGTAHVPSYDLTKYLANRSDNAVVGSLVLAWLVACVPLSVWAIQAIRRTPHVPFLSGLSVMPAIAILELATPVFMVACVVTIGLWGLLAGAVAGLLTTLIVFAAVGQWISEGVNPPISTARTVTPDRPRDDTADNPSDSTRLKVLA